MTEGSSPAPGGYRLDDDALVAAVEIIGRAGAKGLEINCLDPEASISKARWWAATYYSGTRVQVEGHVGPLEALEALVERLLHGAKCMGCGKLTAITDAPVPIGKTYMDASEVDEKEARRLGVCMWERQGKHWVRGCGADAPEGSTREKLARAMAEAGVPSQAIRQARAGYYDDYLSPNPFAIGTLVNDLEANGFSALAERARNGEFDGTKEESDAWAKSEEGQAVFAELLGGISAATFTSRAKQGGKATAVKEARESGEGGERKPWRANSRSGKKKKKRK